MAVAYCLLPGVESTYHANFEVNMLLSTGSNAHGELGNNTLIDSHISQPCSFTNHLGPFLLTDYIYSQNVSHHVTISRSLYTRASFLFLSCLSYFPTLRCTLFPFLIVSM